MVEVRAADLPEGSIVGSGVEALVKNQPSTHYEWSCTDGREYSNHAVDHAIETGARVLRHGYGEEG